MNQRITPDQFDALLAEPLKRAPEEPLPTVNEIADAWQLGWPLRDALLSVAASTKGSQKEQMFALKRTFAFLMRAHLRLRDNCAPTKRKGCTARKISPKHAAEALGLTGRLSRVVTSICEAGCSDERSVIEAHLETALRFTNREIEAATAFLK